MRHLFDGQHCSIVMVSWVGADSSKYIVGMFPFLCRSTSGRRSSITSSCRGGRGRRRRGRGRRSIWPAGNGSGTTARATLPGITTMTKVTAANRAPGAEEQGAAGRTNPSGPALCWPTITWWSWNRSSRCRVSSPRAAPAPLSRPPEASPSCPGSWASNSSSHLRIRRKVLRRQLLQLPQQPLTPQRQHHHHLHHQVAALRSVLSHPAKPSTLGNCLTLGNLRGGRVWTGLRCPDQGKDHHHHHWRQKDNHPGLTWTAFQTRSPRLEGKGQRTDTQQTRTRPALKSSSSTENKLVVGYISTEDVYCEERPGPPSVLSQAVCRSTWSRERRNWWEAVLVFAERQKKTGFIRKT